MRFLLLLSLLANCWLVDAQVDTTIYTVAEEMPRFPSECERLDTTAMVKSECAQRALLTYVAGRAVYPQEAREANLEGTPVISFVVEKNGLVSNPEIVRDPGMGLGSAALRVVQIMQQEVRWRPAFQNGQPIRFQFNLPVRFRLEDPKPYVMAGPDSVYTDLDTGLAYEGGNEALSSYLSETIEYPAEGLDSCRTGQIVVQLLVDPLRGVKVLDLTDYNNLGFEYWYQAIHASHGTIDNWVPATFDGREVPTAIDLTYTFTPENAACSALSTSYRAALTKAQEAAQAIQAGELESAVMVLDPLIEEFPRDAQFRILRAQAHLDANELVAACEDLTMAQVVSKVNWFDAVTSLICR
ncbi:MAG: energy transducer TonB [Bacteroidota bacterium]